MVPSSQVEPSFFQQKTGDSGGVFVARPETTHGGSSLIGNYNRRLSRFIRLTREKEETWNYIQVSLTLFTIAFFVLVAIRPAITTIAGLVGEIKKKEVLTRQMMVKINSLVEAQSNYALMQAEIDVLDSCLPLEFDIARANAQIYGLAGETGMTVKGLNVPELKFFKRSREGEKGGLEEMGLNLSLSGDYEKLTPFLAGVNSLRRLTDFTGYTIAVPEEGGQLKLGISGKLLYWK